ncbi:Protein of unknown function UPF0147 [Ferroglobus placidus DSM 10642]|uniref:UPF0147 protein Ferp_1430 n=1 Tax=Ferroglobus placidus (strain DSM 10642 / AEDII12DO) TaxID=589924 RepID=D3RYL8_FERPA|nr:MULTISPECIES: UPF0147 family protein [Ferroglobus]ADC65581.1 Protein of unknown function UPF0147 [Ferroglobus placidus DSM 10642]
MNEALKNALDILNKIIHDDSVPRNVRRVASEIKEELSSGENIAVKAATAISTLEELSADPNLPMHVRTMIWNLTSQLERLAVE